MSRWRQSVELAMNDDEIAKLMLISRSRMERGSRVDRAKMLLAYRENPSFYAVGHAVGAHHQTVERCVERALAYGPLMALDDRPRPGKEPIITPDAKAWLVNLACGKDKDVGYPHELWTTRLLARHAREHGPAAGHDCLARPCWRGMRASTGRRPAMTASPAWSRAPCARFLARRKSSRIRCATIWSAATLNLNGRWPRFCASIARFRS